MTRQDAPREALQEMTRDAPRAAIVIAAYNAEATIGRAVGSALAQTLPVEVVVVDDGSTDATVAAARAAGGDRVQVLRQPRNAGPAAARNRAIEASRADWIAVLDADDHMAPDRIARLLEEAERDRLDFLADDIYRVEQAQPEATGNRLWSREDFGRLELSFCDFVAGNRHNRFGRRGELGFVKPLMRRGFLDAIGLRYDPDLRLGEDYLLYATALAAGARFRLVDPRGYFAVARPGSLSARHSTRDLGAILAADMALARRPGLGRAERSVLRRHAGDIRKEWAWRRLIDAVRARDAAAIARLGREPPAVLWSLAGKLAEQARLRSARRLRARGWDRGQEPPRP
ncbi:glycosyltransferase family 2 protein [Limimaricola pyoseonensis]|uniref:Succinoglycan biosynthesis protein ExoU n=1 Tax=Limimaricola pyoseonensis TaxID=521013 RepID=A0A1G7J0A7_9RHOB|nr:glycosyltransferase family 2 protein [Limimaricola pyoseonensis]SDF18286.1 succinoglycan biosynthesis protein ExoU [Limimaricola pyoseonensis]